MSIKPSERTPAANLPGKSLFKPAAALVLAALGSIAASTLTAQSYVPPIESTASTTLYTSSAVISPGRVAVDKAGNVFYMVTGGSTSTLMEIPATSPAVTNTAPLTLITGLGQYNAVAVQVDANGNLWATVGNGTALPAGGSTDYISMVEIPAVGGIPNSAAIPSGGESINVVDVTHCATGGTVPCTFQNYKLNSPSSAPINGPQVADFYVDASGNLYFIDVYDNTSKGAYNILAKVNPYTGSGAATVLATNLPSSNHSQVAVDGAGNVYYLDGTTNVVSLVSGGALTTVGNTSTLASAQIASATGISSDTYGNLYISSTAQLSEVPFEGTALNFVDEFGIVNGLGSSAPESISSGGSVDPYGNYYYAYNGSAATNIQQLQINGYNFGKVPVGSLISSSSTPAAPSLTIYFNAAEASVSSYFPTGSPTSNTYLQYLQSFPYSGTKSFGGGTSFTVGQTGTITMNFQPIHPGPLKGSFTPRSGGADDAVINLQGVGAGPEAILLPGTPSQVFNASSAKALNAPQGLAVDTYGDIFLADTGNGKVVADCLATSSVTVAGSGSGGATNSFCGGASYLGLIVQLGTGFTAPAAIALDGANNLYVVDSTANGVTIINGVGLTSTTPVTSTTTFGGTALSDPKGIAVDGYTNIYIADTGNNRIVQAHQYGATNTQNVVYIPSTTLFGTTKLSGPTGLAVDGAGDLFIADAGNNRIVEYTPLGVATVVSTGTLTLNTPTGIAVYPSGALVVTDKTNGTSLLDGANSVALSFGSTYTTTNPQGVALDLAGNIYLSNTTGNQVLELNVTSPQTVSFPNTNDGAISPAKTTQVADLGNASLIFSALAVSTTNYTNSSSSTCTATSTITAGNTCNILTEFSPGATATPGILTASLTATDNQLAYTLATLNSSAQIATFGTSGTQALNLTGTAVVVGGTGTTPQTITFTPLTTPITYATNLTVGLTATATSGGTVFFAVTGTTGGATASSVSGNTLSIVGTGTVTVQATQAGNATYASATPVSQTITINPASQTITFPTVSTVTFGAPPVTLAATTSSGGTVTYAVTSGPGTIGGTNNNVLTFTGGGTVVVAASSAATTDYLAATTVSQSILVNPETQTITFTPPPSPVVLGTGTVTLGATASSGLPVVFSITAGSSIATLNGATLTFTGTGTVTVAANQAGNASFQAATAVSESIVVSPPPDFSLAINPSTLTVSNGEAGTVTVTVTGINGYGGVTAFSCSGLLPGAYCGFQPSTITASTFTTLTVYVPLQASAHHPFNPFVPTATLAVALCFIAFRKRRRLQALLLVVVSVIGLTTLNGCGNSTPASSAPVTSTITVTGTSGTLVHTATFSLTVP
jgi:hypothetical protein